MRCSALMKKVKAVWTIGSLVRVDLAHALVCQVLITETRLYMVICAWVLELIEIGKNIGPRAIECYFLEEPCLKELHAFLLELATSSQQK